MKSTIARTIFSIWSWIALGVIVIVWTPMVAIVRLVTMPFDKGAYAAGIKEGVGKGVGNGMLFVSFYISDGNPRSAASALS